MSHSYQSVGASSGGMDCEAPSSIVHEEEEDGIVKPWSRWSKLGQTLAVIVTAALLLIVAAMLFKSDTAPQVSPPLSAQASVLSEKHSSSSAVVPPETLCDNPDYTKVTLKTVIERTMAGLFPDLQGQKKFEASDVIHVGHHYLVVYDNLFSIGRINEQLAFHSPAHQLLSSVPSRSGDSGFEAILYDEESKTYFVVIESELEQADAFHRASIPTATGDLDREAIEARPTTTAKFHAYIEELSFSPADAEGPGSYSLKDRCRAQFAFASGNKGFEGAVHVRVGGELLMLGLCEGNFCEGGKRGKQVGNGRVVLMRKREATKDSKCEWETVNLLALPATAAFADYSAIAIRAVAAPVDASGNASTDGAHAVYRLAVTSQESSQVWIGELRTGSVSGGSEWSLTDGVVYNFPRSSSCEIEYCNIEGVSFIDDNLLVAVSDKMKGGARQHYRCLKKDQSIHTFVLP